MGRKADDFKNEKTASPASVDPWARLAAAVLISAFEDLASDDDETALDALLWLGLGDGGAYCELLELPSPLAALCSDQPAQKKPGMMRFSDWRRS